jgi:hypothetical protein
MRKIGDQAVVLGASMAGLLAAPVPADAYERVMMVDRDALPNNPENRRGVPQDRHAHVLMPRGTQILNELFPGLLDDLVAGGAPVIRDLGELRFSPGGHPLCLKGRPAQPFICQTSRPFLEVRFAPGSGRCPASRSSTDARSSGWLPQAPGTASPGCGCCPAPPVSRRASTPT